jgi:hypothetical protein
VPLDPWAGDALQVSDGVQLRGPEDRAIPGDGRLAKSSGHVRRQRVIEGLTNSPTQHTPDLHMNIHLPPRPSMRALSICTTSHGGSPRRPLTFRERQGPEVMDASGQIPMAAYDGVRVRLNGATHRAAGHWPYATDGRHRTPDQIRPAGTLLRCHRVPPAGAAKFGSVGARRGRPARGSHPAQLPAADL